MERNRVKGPDFSLNVQARVEEHRRQSRQMGRRKFLKGAGIAVGAGALFGAGYVIGAGNEKDERQKSAKLVEIEENLADLKDFLGANIDMGHDPKFYQGLEEFLESATEAEKLASLDSTRSGDSLSIGVYWPQVESITSRLLSFHYMQSLRYDDEGKHYNARLILRVDPEAKIYQENDENKLFNSYEQKKEVVNKVCQFVNVDNATSSYDNTAGEVLMLGFEWGRPNISIDLFDNGQFVYARTDSFPNPQPKSGNTARA